MDKYTEYDIDDILLDIYEADIRKFHKKQRYLIFDVDGVLLDWHTGFREYYKEIYEFNSDYPLCNDMKGLENWINFKEADHINKDRGISSIIHKMIHNFNISPEFSKLNGNPDFKLNEYKDEYTKIIVLSSCIVSGNYEIQYQRRKDNLEKIINIL